MNTVKPVQPVAPGRRFRGLAPDERRRQRRQQLIDAGLRTFGSRGFHAVGVREVCVEAHLTERYFYESFSNREELFQAVYEHAIEIVRKAIVDAILLHSQAGEPRLMARAALRAFLETLRDDPLLPRILLIDSLSIDAKVSAESRRATQSFSDLVAELVSGLFHELPQHGVDARLLADGLVGSTLYIVMRWAFGGFAEPLETILEHCVMFYDAMIGDAERRLAAHA